MCIIRCHLRSRDAFQADDAEAALPSPCRGQRDPLATQVEDDGGATPLTPCQRQRQTTEERCPVARPSPGPRGQRATQVGAAPLSQSDPRLTPRQALVSSADRQALGSSQKCQREPEDLAETVEEEAAEAVGRQEDDDVLQAEVRVPALRVVQAMGFGRVLHDLCANAREGRAPGQVDDRRRRVAPFGLLEHRRHQLPRLARQEDDYHVPRNGMVLSRVDSRTRAALEELRGDPRLCPEG